MTVYEKEFKEEAVKLAIEIGTEKAAKQLGVPKSTLAGWRKSKKKHSDQAFVGSGKRYVAPETAKEAELLKKIKELEKANEILKDALGFFAKSRKR